MDFFDKADIQSSIRELDQILGSGIFDARNAQHPLFRAAFIATLIPLRNLMYKSAKHAAPITFADDVTQSDKIANVTDLIKYVRDALCDPDSPNHYIERGNIKATFGVLFGAGCLLKTPDFEQASPHADDVCFFFGTQRIFLRRHILRAYEEAKAKLAPLL